MRGFATALARSARIAIALLTAAPVAASAQTEYPNRTIKFVVPIPPGPVADVLPRMLAEKLAARWGQVVIVENRPGAASNIGAEAVAKAQPDGYTLLATPPNPLVINQSFFPKLAFDPEAFVPVTVFAALPYVLVVNPKVPFSTLQELIAFARQNPDKINFASAGTGSAPHLTGEMLKLAASIRMVHVPYTGLGPAMTDLLAGHVDLMIDNLGNALPLVRAGKVKALGVASETRIAGTAGRPGDRRAVSRLPGVGLVRDRGAAEDAAGDRREALAGHCGHASPAGCCQAVRRPCCQASGKLARRNRGVPETGDRTLAQGHRGRRDQVVGHRYLCAVIARLDRAIQ